MTIDIDINKQQADALSQILKRLGFTDVRKLSESDKEAYSAIYALEQIRIDLINKGYNPR